jgi:oxygen-dependent protoporphyrinogen oxidase
MEMLVSSFVSGIHAGDVRQLGIEDAFPKVARWEREHGSVVRGALASRRASGTEPSHGITAFRRGTGALSEALASSLRQPVQLNTPVQALSRAESGFVATAGSAKLYAQHVVVATPPPVTWSLLGEWMNLPALGPMAPIAVVHLMGTDGEPPTGFGVLVPPSQRGSGRAVRALGVLFVSSQVPARAPGDGWLLTVFLGGTTDSSALELSDEALVGVAVRDVASITGFTPVTRHTAVFRQVSAIPQMTPGHLQRVQAFKRSVSSIPGLAVAGNWLGGVSVEHAVQSGHDAASQLLAQEV